MKQKIKRTRKVCFCLDKMAVTKSSSYFEVKYFDLFSYAQNAPRFLRSFADAFLSDSVSDILTGSRMPSSGFNYLAGNGGNDTLISNSLANSFLIGSSNFTGTNSEVDTLIGSSSTSDHFYLSSLYKGSGYAVVKSFQPSRDFVYLTGSEDPGARGDYIVSGATRIQVNYIARKGFFNNAPSTFIDYANGDRLAVIEGYSPSTPNQSIIQNLFAQGALRIT